MMSLDDKKIITFDFGDTLASTTPTYPDRIRMALSKSGFEFTDKEFFEAYHFADYLIYKHYVLEGTISLKISQKVLYETLKDRLKIEASPEYLERTVNTQLEQINFKRELMDKAGDLLDALRSKDFRLAIISNNDGLTYQKCRDLGISDYFEVIVDSTNVGMVKPDSNIYSYTLSRLETEADKAVHIGDLYGADILGGIGSHMDVIWLNHRKCENYEKIEVKQFSRLKIF